MENSFGCGGRTFFVRFIWISVVSLSLGAGGVFAQDSNGGVGSENPSRPAEVDDLAHGGSAGHDARRGSAYLDLQFGLLGRTSDSTYSGHYNTAAKLSGTSALAGAGGGIAFPVTPSFSVGGRASVLFPFSNATGTYQESQLLVVGSLEGTVAARLGPPGVVRPVTLYGTFGGAAGSERAGTNASTTPRYTDREPMVGFTGSGGMDVTATRRVSLFLEVGYLHLRGSGFTDLRVEDHYDVTEKGVIGSIGIRLRIR